MIKVGNKLYARTDSEMVDTLFTSDGTAVGFYKVNKQSYGLYNMQKKHLKTIPKSSARVYKKNPSSIGWKKINTGFKDKPMYVPSSAQSQRKYYEASIQQVGKNSFLVNCSRGTIKTTTLAEAKRIFLAKAKYKKNPSSNYESRAITQGANEFRKVTGQRAGGTQQKQDFVHTYDKNFKLIRDYFHFVVNGDYGYEIRAWLLSQYKMRSRGKSDYTSVLAFQYAMGMEFGLNAPQLTRLMKSMNINFKKLNTYLAKDLTKNWTEQGLI